MFSKSRNLLFISVLISYLSVICKSEDLIPVYIWETQDTVQPSPALQKTSASMFKNLLLEKLEKKPFIVIFAEETLSPEDFAHHDQNGKSNFDFLHKLIESNNAAYKPHVENPIGTIKDVVGENTEVSVASLLRNFNIPKDEALIVNLDDARDDEQRNHMLKRHDSAISEIYKKLSSVNDNILAIYTAHHSSWVTPEDVKHRHARSLLQETKETAEKSDEPKAPEGLESALSDTPAINEEPKGLIVDEKALLLYVSSSPEISLDNKKFNPVNLQVSSYNDSGNVIEWELSGDNHNFKFNITFKSDGYWKLESVIANDKTPLSFPDITAPVGFSYHCFNTSFVSQDEILLLPGFQIQPFQNEKEGHAFDDPYDCVGFTTIPIWTGLFVTTILLLILTFALTFMMDIRTMDKFDDAKGKTITINAE